jgi:hypothetical protein
MSVPIPLTTAQTQSGGGVIASGSFASAGRTQLIFAAASAYGEVNARLGATVSIDGSNVGALQMYSNQRLDLALIPFRAITGLPAINHSVTLTANSSTKTGSGDWATVSVVDLGDNPDLLRSRKHYYGPYVSTRFTTAGGTVLLWVAGSGWCPGAPQPIGVSIRVDGVERGQSLAFANLAGQHLPFVPVQLVLRDLTPGAHTLEVLPLSGTSCDFNDACAIEVLELTAPPAVLSAARPIANAVCSSQQGGQQVAAGTFGSSGGTLVLRVMASAWSATPGSPLKIVVTLDGTARGTVNGFATNSGCHLALVPADIVLTGIPAGQHAVSLVAGDRTITDWNDRASVSVLELATVQPT